MTNLTNSQIKTMRKMLNDKLITEQAFKIIRGGK